MSRRPKAKLELPTLQAVNRFNEFTWFHREWQDCSVPYFVKWARGDGNVALDPDLLSDLFRQMVRESGLEPNEGNGPWARQPRRAPFRVSETEAFSRAFVQMVDLFPYWHDLPVQQAVEWLSVSCMGGATEGFLGVKFRQAVSEAGLTPLEGSGDAEAG